MQITTPPVELADNLWMLGTSRHPMYLLKGKNECAIVEGGIGSMGPLVREQLAELNVQADQVQQVAVTHAHPDHVMAVPMFREMFPNITVLASKIAAKTLSIEKAIAFFTKIDDGFSASLLAEGAIDERHQRPALAENRIAVDRVVKEGDTFDVDPFHFTIIETPGHSDCHICFHDPAAKILIISDATGYYQPDPEYWWPNYFTSYAAYLESIHRLGGLSADVLCLSHNAAITGADAIQVYFQRAIETTEDYHRHIIKEIKEGVTPEQLAETLGAKAYKRSPSLPEDFFQRNCAILIKNSLKHEGMSEAADKG